MKYGDFAIFLFVLILFPSVIWWNKIVLILSSQFMTTFYPQLLATFIGVVIGIPAGLFINRINEKDKDKKILISILTFLKTELISNSKNVTNLLDAAEKILLLQNIGDNDLVALGKFTSILSQKSYIAAQTSIAFASISSDKLISAILNAYLNIQRMIGGVITFDEIDQNFDKKKILLEYIKLCERARSYIIICVIEIDAELKKLDSKLTILD